MKPARDLTGKLDRGETVTGILITHPFQLQHIELAIKAGLDYVVIDAEHMAQGHPLIAEGCRLGRLANFPVILRVQRKDTEWIAAAVDLGPVGLILPCVESAAQLDQVRDGIYMPPRGVRRPGGPSNFWVDQYSYETFKTEVEDDFIILPQIENQCGLDHVNEIAEHEIVTSMAIGPFDLSASLGVCWEPDHPKLAAAFEQVRKAADDAGKLVWRIGDGQALSAQGYRFLCIAEPTVLLLTTLTNMVNDLQKTLATDKDRTDTQPI
jgi:4-hydroxy-2-oxoheptanedioate aldolase